MEPRGIHRRQPIRITDSLVRRFWSRVDRGEPTECWNWTAGFRNGYGAIKHDGHVLSAHRLAYVLTFGEPDDSLVIGHKCDNRACCNPACLEAITPGTNNRDARGRLKFHMNRGEDVHCSVLTESQVRQIMKLRVVDGMGPKAIAEAMCLNRNRVKGVTEGRTWKHITGGKLVRGGAA